MRQTKNSPATRCRENWNIIPRRTPRSSSWTRRISNEIFFVSQFLELPENSRRRGAEHDGHGAARRHPH
jgi:hypothetical protein